MRQASPIPTLVGLLLGAVAAMALHVAIGATPMTPAEFWGALTAKNDLTDIVWQLRLPRAVYALLVGLGLGAVGSAFQALFRNPISDPYVVGVSSGAAVGGAAALVFGWGRDWTGFLDGLVPLSSAALGGLLSLALVLTLATRRGRLDMNTLLVVGVVTGAMLSALLSLILLMGGQDTNVVLRWLLGSLTPSFWNRGQVLALVIVPGVLYLASQARALNLLSMGGDTAHRLGLDSRRHGTLILVVGSIMVAVTVGVVGIIGFLGLVAPHVARRLVGVDWRWSLPASALLGSIILLLADLVAQRLVANAELPVGVLTAILGAPTLLLLMRRNSATS